MRRRKRSAPDPSRCADLLPPPRSVLAHQLDVTAVGHADRNAKTHPRVAIGPVRHRRIDELLVRHDHGDVVVRDDHRAARPDFLHLPGHARDFDPIADRDRAFRQDDEAADEIARDILQAETDADANRAGKNGQRLEVDAGVLQDDENADDEDEVGGDLRDRVLERAIEPAVDEETVEEKTLRPRGKPKDQEEEADEKENLERLIGTPGRGALQAKGMPRPLIALTVKKTSAATLRIVVMIATKLASSLKRLRKRRTTPLWKTWRQTNPRPSRPDKGGDSEDGNVVSGEIEERRV